MEISKNESNGETEKSEDDTEAGTEAEETEDIRDAEIDKQEELPVGCKFRTYKYIPTI